MKMGEKENFLKMTISDPELVQKICEGGMESLSPDDINSLGIEVKAGQMFMGDASQANLEKSNKFRFKPTTVKNSTPLPIKRGFVKFIGLLIVLFIVISVIGIICCKINSQIAFANDEVIGLSLFFVVGLGLCLNEFHVASAAEKYLTEHVQGKCISLESVSRSGKANTKRSVYEYTYRDKVYRSCEKIYANKGYAKMGEVRELLLAPENPRYIYDPVAGKDRKIGGITIGMFFIVLVVVIVVSVCVNG